MAVRRLEGLERRGAADLRDDQGGRGERVPGRGVRRSGPGVRTPTTTKDDNAYRRKRVAKGVENFVGGVV